MQKLSPSKSVKSQIHAPAFYEFAQQILFYARCRAIELNFNFFDKLNPCISQEIHGFLLISQFFADKHDLTAFKSARHAHMNDHGAADTLRAFTVVTSAVNRTRCFFIQPLGIERSGNISCPFDGALQVGTQLVHAAHENAALRSKQCGRHAVALAVDVDDLAGLAQSVR